ncbi:hypothetical protein L7F22_043039 [Adiantum nelumboides]|nr:hypothetical protein [Adiantum nelumboides]
MKKGFRLIACSMGSSSSPHRPRGIPLGFGYGMDSLTTAHVHANDSPTIVRSMGSLSSPHCPRGIPSDFGYGIDSLAAVDLHAIFSHDSPWIVNTNFKWASPPFDKVFPTVSLFQEKACLDHTSTQERKFMKLYEVNERSARGNGIVQIHITEKPNDDSSSAPIFCNPCEGVQLVLDSVFRTKLSFLLSYDGNFLHMKSSTLKRASGSPIIPTGLPGYTIGIHEGGTQADANTASSTDSPGFVDSYAKYVLPHLPSPDDAIFLCRDLGSFKHWLKKHGLKW